MVECLFLLVEIITVIICIHNLYTKDKIFSIYTLIFICIEVIYFNLANRNIMPTGTVPAVYFLFVLYTLVEFRDSLVNSIYNCLLALFLISIFQMVFYFPAIFVYHIFLNEDAMMLFINIWTCIAVIFTGKLKIYRILHNIGRHNGKMAGACILVTIGILVYYIYKIKTYKHLPLDVYLTCLLSLIIITISIYRWQHADYENDLKNKQLESFHKYNESYQSLVELVRKNQHDFDNHLLALTSINSDTSSHNELAERQAEYKEKIMEKNKYNRILYKINDPMLAGYLFHKLMELERQKIKIIYDANIISTNIEYISIYDLIEIIGILLDNAREALEKEDFDKVIKLFVNESKEKLEVAILNISKHYSNEEIINFFKKGYSTKGENRGIGLSKIKEHQKKYKFDIMVENCVEKDMNWLKFSIMINRA